jgi:hypothetical protein
LSILHKIWAWLTKVAPEETEEVLKAELENLRLRLKVVEELLRQINIQKMDLNLSVEKRTRIRQSTCRHLKGGRFRSKSHKDYAIRDFTFIDGIREVACLICGKKWRPECQDWDKALDMLDSTTNTCSSSERIFRKDLSTAATTEGKHYAHSEEEIQDAYALNRLDDESIIQGRFVFDEARREVPATHITPEGEFDGLDIGDANPIKGRQKATPMPDVSDNDIISI